MTEVRVIAVGQEAAGDDGAGFAILEALRRRAVPPGTELVRARDATAVIPLLETVARVIVVDAAVGPPPGQIIALPADEIAGRALQPVSSHGVGLAEAIALARRLFPGGISPSIAIVVVTIARPDRYRVGLSPAIAAVVDEAADRILLAIARENCPEP